MAIEILSITFNSGPAAGSAINLRFDGARSVPTPEWPGAAGSDPQHSPAAFTIGALHSNRAVIRAQFRRTAQERTVVIEAKQRSGILGDIRPFRLDFDSDVSDFILLPLDPASDLKVSVNDQEWEWSWTEPDGKAQTNGTTKHRIYVLLDKPGPPWDADSGNQLLWPWTRVLDYACKWACKPDDATTADQAAGNTLTSLIALRGTDGGDSMFRYDRDDTYASFARDPFLNLDRLLETLAGDPLGIHKANCSDFACIVTTFANAVGCRLAQTVLQLQPDAPGKMFSTNPLQPLGSKYDKDDKNEPLQFVFHEVAWSGSLDETGRIWDACFQLDKDGDPSAAPHVWDPTKGLPFGRPGALGYLDRLVRPIDRPNLEPVQPIPNRPPEPQVRPSSLVQDLDADILDLLKPEPSNGKCSDRLFIWGLSLAGTQFKGYTLLRIHFRRGLAGRLYIDSYWRPENRVSERFTLRLEVEAAQTTQAVKQITLREFAASARPLHKFKVDLRPPHGLRVLQEGTTVAQGQVSNIAYILRNVGFDDADVSDLQQKFEDLLVTRPAPAGELKLNAVIPPARGCDLRLDLPQPAAETVWYKLFSSTGDFFSQAGNVFYSPGDSTTHLIDVYQMDCQNYALHARIEFDVS